MNAGGVNTGAVTTDGVSARVDPGEVAARIAAAVENWRRAVAGSGMPDTLLASGPQAAASWLDLTHAHPSGLAQLFAARPTRLSSLFRESDTHAGAWRQARSIRASALVLSAQRGVQGCCLAIGVASWRPQVAESSGPVLAPIVLRGCSVRPRGAGDDDFDLDLEDAVLINPELIRELVETYGIEADGAHLAALAQGPKGFDPRPVYAWLEERCRSLRAFKIERSLVLATFAAGSGAVLADLDAAVPAIAAHRLLARVAAHEGTSGPQLLSLDGGEPGTGDLVVTTRATEDGPAIVRTAGDPFDRTDATGPDEPEPRPAVRKPLEFRPTAELIPAQLRAGEPLTTEPPSDPPDSQVEGDDSAAGLDELSIETDPGVSLSSPAQPGESRRLAVVGRLGPRGARPIKPAPEPDPAEELLVLDLDPAQHEALAAALRGENVVIEGPPGSGATHTVAAAIAGLVAAGRRVLVLSPRRASTEALLTQLEQAGISDLVLDLRDSINGRPATRTTGAAAALRSGLEAATAGRLSELPKPGRATDNDEIVQTIRQARALLDGEAEALHEIRPPWGISAYDAMVSLAEINGRLGAPTGGVRLGDDVLAQLDAVTRERLRVHLHAAAGVGAFTLTRVDTRWYDAQVTTNAQARRALEAALVLRAGLERAMSAMDAVTTAAGLRPATTVAGWLPLLDLLLGVRAVVDAMVPQLYGYPLEDLANAVAPRGQRIEDDRSRGDRRRLRRQAQALVRPGVHVANRYEVLLTAARQRRQWADYSLTDEGPRVVVGLSEAEAAVHRVSEALDVLTEVFAGTPSPDLREIDLEDLQQRVFDLAGDTEGILGQPRRATLVDGLAAAGLGELVDDLRSRRVGPDQIDAEFDLVWWSSVRDSIVRADPRLSRHDPNTLRQATIDLREAETARIGAGAALVRTAVIARAAKVVAGRPDQVRSLRRELAQDDRRPRMVDLVRSCGDVLAALTPIWMMSPDTVAACLAPADPGMAPIVDTVVVDDAGSIGLPEVVAALARGAQVIVAGDRRRLAPPDGSTSVIEALAPFTRVCRLDRDHRARDGRMLVPLAPRYPEGWRLTPGTAALPPLDLEAVPDGVAVPPPGEELPVSSDAEVYRVVDLVERHALRQPEESLVVVTLSERHAERIEEALRLEVAERPLLGRWLAEQWQDGHPEPFVVRSVQGVLGVERDAAIVSIGLARTPHGRILHRFGVLDGDKGAAALTTAISRSRGRTTVVCCFTADDLIVDRLRTAGARLLRDVLLAAGGKGTAGVGRVSATTDGLVADLRDRLAAAGLPVRMRVGDGAWPLDLAVSDPRVPGRMLVAVDLDGPAFASRACRERERNRPARWERAGWAYCKVSALDLFHDPALEVARIRDAWNAAMDLPLPPEAYAAGSEVSVRSGAVAGSRPVIEVEVLLDEGGFDTADTFGDQGGFTASVGVEVEVFDLDADRSGADPFAGAGAEPLEGPEYDGSLPSYPMDENGPEDDDTTPVLPERAGDDTDEGWGEREPENRDDEYLRDRPPHWD